MSSAAGGSDSCFLHLTNAGGDIRSIEVPRENCTSFPLRFMPLCLEFRIFKAYKHLLVEKTTIREQFADGSPPVSRLGRSAETLLPLKRRELSPRDTLQALLDLLDGWIHWRFHGWQNLSCSWPQNLELLIFHYWTVRYHKPRQILCIVITLTWINGSVTRYRMLLVNFAWCEAVCRIGQLLAGAEQPCMDYCK